MKKTVFCVSVFLLLAVFWFMPRPAQAKPYYEGKVIEFMGESRVGGGTDTMARIIASVIPKHIPGKPKIVVRTMPGAAGAIANNIFYATGKPDGLHLMMNSSSPISLQLKSRDIAKYDLTKYVHIGHVSRGSGFMVVRKEVLNRLYDPKAEPVVCGTKEGEEPWMTMPVFGKEFLGWNVRWIAGYSGTSDMELAFRRKEIDMFGTSNSYIIERLQNEGIATPITVNGTWKNNKFVRRKDYPDVPTFIELLGAKKPTGVAWQAYMAWVGGDLVDKFLVGPRNMPKEYASILIGAFGKTVHDPQFDEQMKRMVSNVYDVGVGKETGDLLKEVLSASPEAIDYIHKLQIKFGIIGKK